MRVHMHLEAAQVNPTCWILVDFCGAARFGDMPQYFIACTDCTCKIQKKFNKFSKE